MEYKVIQPGACRTPFVGIKSLEEAVNKANEMAGSQIHDGTHVIATAPTSIEKIHDRWSP